ncbi:hypothetical protein ACFV6F_17165 [Kitasatospora phosalacinea]|uniref:hypothetical protein n=1 Tax=Kitasatospora phosalacinea TaxID=2065 RepID=UPI003664881C
MSHHTHGTHQDAPADEWPPTETPEARMTGEGSPPPSDESEKTSEDGPEFAVPVSSPPEAEDG